MYGRRRVEVAPAGSAADSADRIGIGELAQRLEAGLWLREMVVGVGLWWWRRVVGSGGGVVRVEVMLLLAARIG